MAKHNRGKGERGPSGGGEREQSAERKKVKREIGQESINAVNKYYERKRGEKHSAAEAESAEAKPASNETLDEDLEAYARELREATDKRGQQKYSEATIQKAIEAKKSGEEFSLDDYEAEQRKLAQEAFEQKRQAEMKNILAGRTPEVAVREMTRDMKKLADEILRMDQVVYLDPAMAEYQKGQIRQATEQYGSMSLRRDRVLAEMAEAQQEAALFEQEETSPVSGEFDGADEADANTAEKLSLAAIDQLMSELGEQDTELRTLLEKKRQEIEQRASTEVDEDLFAQVDQGVKDMAEQTEAGVKADQRSQEYWDAMAAMAAEAEEHPGRWMSEEEKVII